MRKCSCLRYAALVAGAKDEVLYIFIDGESELIPVEAAFPLEDFETDSGALKIICPYYNFLKDGKLIPRAYNQMRMRKLSRGDREVISEAVENCEYFVDIKKFLVFNERYKEIIELFCEKYNQRLIVRLLKHFLSFIQVRGRYMHRSLCDGVSPDEKKKCFDELWISAFARYLNDVGFAID